MSERNLGSPSRRESLRRLAWRLETPAGLIGMFAVALLMRVLIAPHAGFYGDLRLFRVWAQRLADVGPHKFYAPGQFADYPPGYLYVLWVTGKISATPGYLLLKLPALVCDLGLAWIAGTLAARIAPASLRELWPVRTLVAASVLFNPAVIALSAVWGQVDVVPAMFILWSLLLLFTGRQSLQREIGAFLLFAVAIAMKPQSGFVLPIMLYALYRRYLHRKSRDEQIDGAISIALSGALSLGLWSISGLAFGLSPVELVRFYKQSASVYPVSSANAFNLWGVVGFWRPDSSYKIIGTLALAAGIVFVLRNAHRAIERGVDESRVLTVAAAIVSLLAYTLLTRMHERYMFLALAGLTPLVFVRQLRLALAGLSALFILNLWYPYAFFNAEWHVQDFHVQPLFGWLFGPFTNDTWQKKVWSLAVVAIAFAVAWRGIRWVAQLQPATETVPEPAAPRLESSGVLRLERLAAAATPAEPVGRVPWRSPARWGPLALVALTCAFGLFILRAETSFAPFNNDSSFHLEMVNWADAQIGEGRVPLDGWFPYLTLGSPQFHHYQSLPHTLTAYTARATGASDSTTFVWYVYLLLALWPISIYLATRLLGWDRWTAAAAAAVSPLIVGINGYGYEHGSYTWRGYGVYSQEWAMWLLPLAWGLTWRAVAHGKRYAAAAAAVALTIACHFITGYLAMLTIGVWVLVLADLGFWRRVGRAAVAAGGAVLVASWVLVPLIGDTKWTTQSAFYTGSIFNDSYGAHKVLGWLLSAQLFDSGRFPIVTPLAFAGIAICIARWRSDIRARALLGVFTLSLFLFFGRPTWGRILDLLPGMKDVQIHRFVMGVDLAGILLAGVTLGWLLRTAYTLAGRHTARYPAAVAVAAPIVLAVVVLASAWNDRFNYDKQGGVLIRAQQADDRAAAGDIDTLVNIVKASGDGRVYSGLRANWGKDYKVGYAPVYEWYAYRQVDAIGFTFRTIASLSNDVEASFDETNPAQYEMYNVRYLILPAERTPPVLARQLAASGANRLYEVQTSGYMQVVDRAAPLTANRTNLNEATDEFRNSHLASRGIYPGIGFAGAAGPPPTFSGSKPPRGPAGTVLSQDATIQDGFFTASVHANRRAVVLLKATYDPRWTATVDGASAKPVMMAPSLVGVEVSAGRHSVTFRYKPYAHYPLLLTIGLLTLLGLAIVDRRELLPAPVGHWTGRTSPERATSSERAGEGS
jgi:Gpi18-like mannosyltransferase